MMVQFTWKGYFGERAAIVVLVFWCGFLCPGWPRNLNPRQIRNGLPRAYDDGIKEMVDPHGTRRSVASMSEFPATWLAVPVLF